jgi:hypothetical protein
MKNMQGWLRTREVGLTLNRRHKASLPSTSCRPCIDGVIFGRIPLSALTTDHIVQLQSALSAKSQENGSAYKRYSRGSYQGKCENRCGSCCGELAELFASEQKEKSPRESKGLKMERVRRVELPTLCLATIQREKKRGKK